MTKEKGKVTEKELLVLRKTEGGNGNFTKLRIVSWNDRAPKLENRRFYTTEEGEVRPAKAVGLGLEDLKVIDKNFKKICDLLPLTETEKKAVKKAGKKKKEKK